MLQALASFLFLYPRPCLNLCQTTGFVFVVIMVNINFAFCQVNISFFTHLASSLPCKKLYQVIAAFCFKPRFISIKSFFGKRNSKIIETASSPFYQFLIPVPHISSSLFESPTLLSAKQLSPTK